MLGTCRSFAAASIMCLSLAQFASADMPTTRPLFDPEHYMRVSEVKAGMTGYGLSVFSGSKIERFDVEVVSVLKNFNPKDDVVLIRCKGANLEHTGAIAGMSGSPIYLKDDAGRERMLGAHPGLPRRRDIESTGVAASMYPTYRAPAWAHAQRATFQADRATPSAELPSAPASSRS